jgi:hypothetical protein
VWRKQQILAEYIENAARKSHLEELTIDLIVIGRRCKLQAVLDCVVRKFVL